MNMNRRNKQQGAILITVLMLMVIMTLIAVSSMENTILEERMASNFGASIKTLQVAEFAAKEAENWIEDNVHVLMLDGFEIGDQSFAEFAGASASCATIGTGIAVGAGSVDGLYSVVALNNGIHAGAGGDVTCVHPVPCQDDPDTCAFDPTDEDAWDDVTVLSKGYITLGQQFTVHDKSYIAHDVAMTAVDSNAVYKQPQVIIEYLGAYEVGAKDLGVKNYQGATESPKRYMFRVTVIAWGKDENTRYVVRSYYQTAWS